MWKTNLPSHLSGLRADKAILEAWKDTSTAWVQITEAVSNTSSDSKERPILTRSRVQELLDNQCILVNKKSIAASLKLAALDEITVELPSFENVTPDLNSAALAQMSVPVVFEDEHLVVINKPQGIVVHPSPSQPNGALTQILAAKGISLAQAGAPHRPGIVHRIDQQTSGLLVVAKTDEAYYGLQSLFASHTIEREYLALVYGHFEKALHRSMTVTTLIGRNPNLRTKMAIVKTGGREAITNFRTLEILSHTSLVLATLETGRTHQVRVHLTSLGHSILADPVYGEPSDRDTKLKKLPTSARKLLAQIPGQLLHARKLAFQHPITKEQLCFEAEPWENFKLMLNLLKP